MDKLNIVYKQIKELKPYKKNAKKHNKEQVEQIANSIKEFGFTQPVIIDKNNEVVAGHGRILGAKKAGLKQVPTVCLEDLTEEQIKAYRLVDNKLNESEWDYIMLDKELNVLEKDIDMGLFGFELAEEQDEEYKDFVDKFKPKKTTDECYTPDEVYNVVKEWAVNEYEEIDRNTEIVRPFYPNGDYQKFEYKQNTVVIDNPPFSIFSEIVKFYQEHNIKYFLFYDTRTIFGALKRGSNIVIGNKVVYHNGANVNTSFCTNMGDSKITVDGDLIKKIKEANGVLERERVNLDYPSCVVNFSRLQALGKKGGYFKIKSGDCFKVVNKVGGNAVYDNVALISSRCQAALQKAEQKAEQKVEQKKVVVLSKREKEIVNRLK